MGVEFAEANRDQIQAKPAFLQKMQIRNTRWA